MTCSPLLKNILYYGLSIVFMKGLSLIMLPFISHHLTPQEMGRLELLTTFAIFMSLFVAAGLEDCLFRFASHASREKANSIIASLYGWSLVFGVVFYTAAWLSAGYIATNSGFDIESIQLQLVWAGVALEGAITLPLAVMRMRDQAGLFFFLVLARTCFQALLTVIFLLHYGTVTSILAASVIATVTQGLVLAWWQYKTTGIKPLTQQLSKIFQYGLPLVLSGLCLFALNGVDRIVIAEWTSLTELGLYSVGAKFALATILLMQPFGMWWRPKRFKYLSASSVDCSQMLMVASIVLASIMISVGAIAPLLINWLMPNSYAAASFIAIAMVALFGMREYAEIFNLGILTRDNTVKLLGINITSAALGITCCILFTAYYGVVGCIGALLLTQGFRTIVIYVMSQKTVKLNLSLSLLFVLFLAVTLSLCMSFYLALYFQGLSRIVITIALWVSIHALLLVGLLTIYQKDLPIVVALVHRIFSSKQAKDFAMQH